MKSPSLFTGRVILPALNCIILPPKFCQNVWDRLTNPVPLREGRLLASTGTRGVIVMKGHVEEEPGRSVFLVRFEDQDLNLGQPIGCWVEDLRVAEEMLN